MKTSQNTRDYEPLRTWALHPSPIRPPGLAQLLRGGVVTWLHATQPLPAAPLRGIAITQTVPGVTPSLSTLVAAMIAEVFP